MDAFAHISTHLSTGRFQEILRESFTMLEKNILSKPQANSFTLPQKNRNCIKPVIRRSPVVANLEND